MKKRLSLYDKIIIIILAIGLLNMTAFFGCKIYRAYFAGTFKVINTPVKVNDEFYKSETPMLIKDKVIYMPLSEVVKLFQDDLTIHSGFRNVEITYNNRKYTLDKWSHMVRSEGQLVGLKDSFSIINRIMYVSLDFLKEDMSCHVYDDDLQDSPRTIIYVDNYKDDYDYSWTKNTLVAHALGDADGKTYTNSFEAFDQSYKEGFRVFEVDLCLTADGKIAATHDWSAKNIVDRLGFQIAPDRLNQPLTMTEFKDQLIKGEYVPLAWTDIVNLMVQHPDIYIITDTKDTENPGVSDCFNTMIKEASEIDKSVLDRVIPQIYNEEMFHTISGIYPWKSVIYTLYSIENGEYSQEIVDFVYKNSIQVVTTSEEHANDKLFHDLYEHGVKIYMHTYDDKNEVVALKKKKGIYGVYTNKLKP